MVVNNITKTLNLIPNGINIVMSDYQFTGMITFLFFLCALLAPIHQFTSSIKNIENKRSNNENKYKDY